MFKELKKSVLFSYVYLEYQGFSRYRGPLNVKMNKKKTQLVSMSLQDRVCIDYMDKLFSSNCVCVALFLFILYIQYFKRVTYLARRSVYHMAL